jgi:hypothetical protein
MMRRSLAIGLVLSISFLLPTHLQSLAQTPPGAPAPLTRSGALTPAPVNADFRSVPAGADVLSAPVPGASASVEPGGWRLDSGRARPQKVGSETFAALFDGDATLTSSAFTLRDAQYYVVPVTPPTSAEADATFDVDETATPAAPPSFAALPLKVSFRFKLFAAGARENVLRAFVLSGSNFGDATEVFVHSCACASDWQTGWIDATKWAGQDVKLRFVRANGSPGAIGIDDVAMNLLESKIGRDRSSAHRADPVNTSNGNFRIDYGELMRLLQTNLDTHTVHPPPHPMTT